MTGIVLTKGQQTLCDALLDFNTGEYSTDNVVARTTRMRWYNGICSAVEHLHALDLAHNDIKAQNIVVNKQNEARLISFGTYAEVRK